MRRSAFIKNLIGFWGLSILPAAMVKSYHRYYLLQSFIRGFRFYEGPKLLNKMEEGNLLELVREPDNEYDRQAIALKFNQHKIGYIPKEDNAMLSKLMDADVVHLQAEITHLNKQAQAWENVRVGVYILKETQEPVPDNAKYLTVLDTPRYRSLKINNEKIITVNYEPEDADDAIMDSEEFYEAMVENSKDNSIYDILHIDFESPGKLQEAISEGKMIVNKNNLPPDLVADKLVHAVEDVVLLLDNFFDKKGYVVANVNRVASLSGRIDKVLQTIDNTGRQFFEIKFS